MDEDKERVKRRLAGRIHQRRYREKFTQRVETLEAEIAKIKSMLVLTSGHKHKLEHQLQSHICVKGHVHLSKVKRFAQLFLTGWCGNPQSVLREKQLAFVDQSLHPELEYLGTKGIGHWVHQMQRHTEVFASTFFDIQDPILIAQGEIVIADVVLSLRLTHESLLRLFPYLLELPQVPAILHHVLHIRGKYVFYFKNGRMSKIGVDLNVLSGLTELLQDAALAIQVIQHSYIQGNAYIL